MLFASLRRRRLLFVGGAALVAAGAVVLALGPGGAVIASSQALSPRARAVSATAAPPPKPVDPNLYPFGAPTGNGDFKVPPPPQSPTLVPTIGTKTTQRLYGGSPFEEAVSITQHIWPAVVPLNVATENDNDPDRPWGLTLLTPDDPLTAISAVPLIHFPDDAPILYVTNSAIPLVTLNEIKRLGDTGISRFNNVDVFLVGAAANAGVENQLKSMGIKYVTVTAPNVPELANRVDKLYGSIENPDTDVANMTNGMENVMVGSMDGTDYRYLLPATHWVAHMASGMLWVNKNGIPPPTIDALKRRNGQARIYLFGGPNQISGAVAKQLAGYGTIIRVTNDDITAFNATPIDSPIDTALAFAKMWDPGGMVGWKITGPGHGFTLVDINDWQAAVASAPLSHLGFHAPLLFTDSAAKLPAQVEGYYQAVAPTYLTTPADGPYNMTYVIGSWSQITWPEQARVDYISEMTNRRVWNQNTGGRYTDSSQ
ncbi:MAG: cell wall-binding repeat-containing protein [Acidimicrobiales bacterium]|nr:cell wall-binding repeat-containing protein [Acidimicrobiales bacterium]